MDDLADARRNIELAIVAVVDDRVRAASAHAQIATAELLLAIIERLDRMSAVSGDGTSAFLRVDA